MSLDTINAWYLRLSACTLIINVHHYIYAFQCAGMPISILLYILLSFNSVCIHFLFVISVHSI